MIKKLAPAILALLAPAPAAHAADQGADGRILEPHHASGIDDVWPGFGPSWAAKPR